MTSSPPAAARRRVHVRVEGIVQGVGFRPYVHRLATELGLGGVVGNDARGVFIELEGQPYAVERFVHRLREQPPPLARIEHLAVSSVRCRGDRDFTIAVSDVGGPAGTLVSPDVATCSTCLAEIDDPADRRHRYAFANCTDCGPRFTIVRDVPYDRARTTMADFAMCTACDREYHDPTDRRFHAQPVCCPACGPRLTVLEADGRPRPGDPLEVVVAALRAGEIVAVKGLGGYHLAADATSDAATETLRTRKHREEKPFAVMVADLSGARRLCTIGPEEAALLQDPARPIVLLQRRHGCGVSSAVAPENDRLGVMLPYTPLHHLLVAGFGRPLVLTSGNVSDEPIAFGDDDARRRLAAIADLFLVHDRAIHVRVDDSVAHVAAGRPQLLRRSRGYAPEPVTLDRSLPRPVLAVGAELKSTICLAEGHRAFVSHHIGDLGNYETYRSFTAAIEHFGRLFEVHPEVVAHDLHPGYLSTEHAVGMGNAAELDHPLDLVPVQHHHAHIASCLADNGEEGPVIGLALDGTGYGSDGTIWGGEVLIADLVDVERVGHLSVVPLPGGEAAIREPWRVAAAHLEAAYEDQVPDGLAVAARNADRWETVLAVARAGINSPVTSSAGRLFDAVAAILGVRDAITYEGQAAIELERHADRSERGTYAAAIVDGEPFVLPAGELVRAVVDDLSAGVATSVIAARFHHAVADLLVAAAGRARDRGGPSAVALSGGVFQNVLLLERTVAGLEAAGHRVLTHRRVPTNDGGISLGQVAVAGARDRAR